VGLLEGSEIGERLGVLEKYFNVGYGDGKFVGELKCGKDVGSSEGKVVLGKSVVAYVGNDDVRSDGNCEGERLVVTSLEVGLCVGLKDM